MNSNGQLDRFDMAIVHALLKNSRKSLQEIGSEIGLSQTACWNRVKAMEERGVILGYTINVDLENIGYRDTFIVQVILETHSEKTLNEFGRALDLIPEVTEAYLVSGEYDYYMKVAKTRGTTNDYCASSYIRFLVFGTQKAVWSYES